MHEVEHFLKVANKLGEGPLWHQGESALYWVDIEKESFHRFYPDTAKQETYQVGQPIGCLAFRSRGGLILGLRDGFNLWDFETQKVELIHNPEIGEGKCTFQRWQSRPERSTVGWNPGKW